MEEAEDFEGVFVVYFVLESKQISFSAFTAGADLFLKHTKFGLKRNMFTYKKIKLFYSSTYFLIFCTQ